MIYLFGCFVIFIALAYDAMLAFDEYIESKDAIYNYRKALLSVKRNKNWNL